MVQGDNCKPERESIKDKKKEESYIGDRREKKGEKLFTQQNYQSAHEAEIVTNIARLRDFRDLEGIKSNAQSRFVVTSRVGRTHESSGRGTTLRPVDECQDRSSSEGSGALHRLNLELSLQMHLPASPVLALAPAESSDVRLPARRFPLAGPSSHRRESNRFASHLSSAG